MKLAACVLNGQNVLVAQRENECVNLTAENRPLPADVQPVLEQPELWSDVEAAWPRAPHVDIEQLTWRPPITRPSKILCVGLNYADHARETGAAVPTEPVIFNKLVTTLIGHLQPIVLPRISQEVDYEAELVVVIGRTGRDIPVSEARQYVAGYTCGHDVSARDWQKGKPGRQWLLGKSFDTFAPLGPWFVTPDEIDDPQRLPICLRNNGEILQQSNSDQLIFSIDTLIAYVSQVCTLLPGDLLFTGTPPGVGVARQPPRFLQAGDSVEVEIGGIGCLRNPVVAGG